MTACLHYVSGMTDWDGGHEEADDMIPAVQKQEECMRVRPEPDRSDRKTYTQYELETVIDLHVHKGGLRSAILISFN